MSTAIKVRFGKSFLEDLGHKMSIVQCEPDLQESYGLTLQQVDEFIATIPMNPNGGMEIEIPAHMLECVRGEMENMSDIAWSNASSEGIKAIGYASAIDRQLTRLPSAE